ncbi:MAG TPA: 3'-5' exonuclease [Clostridia bacterium]|nr:MAG: 3'-5' exoribonuclease YhaM [Firmicutes bacterium ADurb.Bin146]HOD94017.1 3'-5' exonuclease [Clostridia bacterium]
MADIKITDLKNGMEIKNELYILWYNELKKASNNKYYIDFQFRDKTGEISGKKWDATVNEASDFQNAVLYFVSGRVTEFQGALQLNVSSIRKAPEQIQRNIADFVQSAPFSSEDMLKKAYEYMDYIKDEELKKLCVMVYDQYEKQIMYYPAAKVLHHSVRGGFLYHITTMLDIAKGLSYVYNNINTDFLYAGILLHDVMKLKEMNANECGIADYTMEGQLMGHIEIGICYIGEMSKKVGLSENKELLLKHMILSHHYIPEHGSTKMPMFLEAELLHHIDLIDARSYDFNKAYETLDKGSITERAVYSLDRKVLRPDFEK